MCFGGDDDNFDDTCCGLSVADGNNEGCICDDAKTEDENDTYLVCFAVVVVMVIIIMMMMMMMIIS